MSDNILNKPLVLKLNRLWQVTTQRTVADALVDLNSGRHNAPACLGVDIGYEKNADGSWNFAKPAFMNPVSWEQWIQLPIRDFDFVVHTPKLTIRVPTAIIAMNYAGLKLSAPSFSPQAIFERDGGRDQYSGEFVPKELGNLDHVIPRDLGGEDSFENVVWCARARNSAKANKLPHEVGLKLIRTPKAPKPLPPSARIKKILHPDWQHFLN